ncbi:MAG: cell division protein ZapA [Filifactor alocis]|nr:cell division protein ZapA [Filifactor alocis]
MNKITIKILNHEYTIVGEESKDYLLELASYVAQEMEVILQKNPKFSYTNCAVLTAINITDQLFREKKKSEAPEKEYNILFQKQESLELELIERNLEIERLRKQLDEQGVQGMDMQRIKAEFEEKLAEKQKEVEEADRISNEFQNRMYRLQLELEKLKGK